ncbi:28437_t:CDS:1 [Dentiscutata erythropus]|uniref:28437_t:CDS:1 n=1 Tax=Dentiscutata erythropus TaxID=1348616 RepID=A0A9N9G503_9GLOM|nr:28437_t:CDS:1 [Dentiscutata erythropus]
MIPINSYETTTEVFQSLYLNSPNNQNMIPSYETPYTMIPFVSYFNSLNNQNTIPINSHETTTEVFQFPYLNSLNNQNMIPINSYETPYLNFETAINYHETNTEVFQSPYLNSLINSYETPYLNFETANNQNIIPINSHETTTEVFQSPYLNSPNNQNMIPINETTTELFQSPYLNSPNNQNITPINPYENTTVNSQSFTGTYNTIPTFGSTEAFIDLGLTSNNQNTTSINSHGIVATVVRQNNFGEMAKRPGETE